MDTIQCTTCGRYIDAQRFADHRDRHPRVLPQNHEVDADNQEGLDADLNDFDNQEGPDADLNDFLVDSSEVVELYEKPIPEDLRELYSDFVQGLIPGVPAVDLAALVIQHPEVEKDDVTNDVGILNKNDNVPVHGVNEDLEQGFHHVVPAADLQGVPAAIDNDVSANPEQDQEDDVFIDIEDLVDNVHGVDQDPEQVSLHVVPATDLHVVPAPIANDLPANPMAHVNQLEPAAGLHVVPAAIGNAVPAYPLVNVNQFPPAAGLNVLPAAIGIPVPTNPLVHVNQFQPAAGLNVLPAAIGNAVPVPANPLVYVNQFQPAAELFPCYVCGNNVVFQRARDLSTHNKAEHYNAQAGTCNHCNDYRGTVKGLANHLPMHYRPRPYPCPRPNCDRVFMYPFELSGHLSRLH